LIRASIPDEIVQPTSWAVFPRCFASSARSVHVSGPGTIPISKLTARGSAFQYRTVQNASVEVNPLQKPPHQPSGLHFGSETAFSAFPLCSVAHVTNFITSVGSLRVGAERGGGVGADGAVGCGKAAADDVASMGLVLRVSLVGVGSDLQLGMISAIRATPTHLAFELKAIVYIPSISSSVRNRIAHALPDSTPRGLPDSAGESCRSFHLLGWVTRLLCCRTVSRFRGGWHLSQSLIHEATTHASSP
jgi:hypothetical protein